MRERLRQALTDPSLGPLTRTATTEHGAITDRQPLQVKRHSCALLRSNAEVAGVQAESFIRCAHYGMYAVQTAAMPRSRSLRCVGWRHGLGRKSATAEGSENLSGP